MQRGRQLSLSAIDNALRRSLERLFRRIRQGLTMFIITLERSMPVFSWRIIDMRTLLGFSSSFSSYSGSSPIFTSSAMAAAGSPHQRHCVSVRSSCVTVHVSGNLGPNVPCDPVRGNRVMVHHVACHADIPAKALVAWLRLSML